MPRKSWYNIIREPPENAETNSKTEETTVGSMTRGPQISREQPRDRAPPFLSSSNRAPASRINESFRAPCNDKRLAPSMDDHESEDEDYDPETDEVLSFDDHTDDLFAAQEAESQNNDEKCKDTDYWNVTIIDSNFFFIYFLEDGVRKQSKLSMKEAIALPSNTKIILPFNKEMQSISQATGLFSGFLGSLGADYYQFPIYEESWKYVNKTKKEHAYDMIKKKCKQNALNWSKQLYTHTGGFKTLARKKDEVEKEQGRPVTRRELFIITHKKKMARISIPMRVLLVKQLRILRGSAGPCPTQVFGNAIEQPSGSGEKNEEYERRIAELTAKIEEEQAKRQSTGKVWGYIIQQQGGNLPADVAAVLDDLGSIPTSSRARPTSSGNHDSQQK
ncbi:hypothetical protein Ahy_B10g101240 [Arachis hypogaea]|uniref:Uncharacterized protein n=1 Tax=Arachis hypogaea TaxID=3818 RepID=A0A444WYX6_ARAHY|nr:hypothetical protein Ahy_B10g101240 [Arachis hypogaea]